MINVRDARAYLIKGKGKSLKSGGMWVYDNEIDRTEGDFEDGDIIDIDIPACSLNVRLTDKQIKERKDAFKPLVKPIAGYLKRYRDSVTAASDGAVLKK